MQQNQKVLLNRQPFESCLVEDTGKDAGCVVCWPRYTHLIVLDFFLKSTLAHFKSAFYAV